MYATTTTAEPSHRPSRTSARRSGRARIARATPDSSSPPIAGAPMNAAVMASTKLNMNAIRIRTCDTPIRICSSAVPSSRARLTRRSRPQADQRDGHDRQRGEDPDDSPADELANREPRDDDHSVSSVGRRDELEEARLERSSAGLDGMDATAGRDDRGHDVRDPGRGERADRQPVAVGRERPEAIEAGATGLIEVADPQPDAVGGDDLVERTRRDRPAPMQDDHPVADPLDLGQQVRIEDDRRASIPRRADDRPNVGPADRIERRGRLVEEDQLGLAEQRDTQAEPLLHALREAAHRVVGPVGQPDPVERLVGGRAAPRTSHAGELGVEGQDLAGAQPGLVAEQLGQVADPRASQPVAERRPEDAPGPAGRAGQAEHELDRRGLARHRSGRAGRPARRDRPAGSGRRGRSSGRRSW